MENLPGSYTPRTVLLLLLRDTFYRGRTAYLPTDHLKQGVRGLAEPDFTVIDRFLRENDLDITVRDLIVPGAGQRLSALCWLEHDGQVLLLRRRKEPFVGYLTAPGGKIEPTEDPRQCVVREMKEEAGIDVVAPRLQLITSEQGPEHYRWVVFIFHCREYRGQVGSTEEGTFVWVPRAGLAEAPLPEVDRRLLPFMLPEHDDGVYLARIRYRDDHSVADLSVTPVPAAGRRDQAAGHGPASWKA